jgi:hypothetical protein
MCRWNNICKPKKMLINDYKNENKRVGAMGGCNGLQREAIETK